MFVVTDELIDKVKFLYLQEGKTINQVMSELCLTYSEFKKVKKAGGIHKNSPKHE